MTCMDRCWSRRETLRALGFLATSLAVPSWLAGCRTGGPPTPPEIAYDRDTCDWCHMTIDAPKLAAAFVPASGRAQRFGEPGCLLSWLAPQSAPAGVAFVAVQEDGSWLKAEHASFVRGPVRTPMRFDLVAWRNPPDGVSTVDWPALRREGKPNAHQI